VKSSEASFIPVTKRLLRKKSLAGRGRVSENRRGLGLPYPENVRQSTPTEVAAVTRVRGGYGVVLLVDGQRRELSGGFAHTTNNRMELMACIKGLEALDGTCPVTVHSDSQYVVNGITKGWARRWKRNNWMRNADEPAENSDLWARLLDLCEQHDVEFQWVRGHNGNRENERCDRLVVEMTQCRDLPPDHGYWKK
jgi:ribonuclease HI